MSYQPFSRADRKRWARDRPTRRLLPEPEWESERFAAWELRHHGFWTVPAWASSSERHRLHPSWNQE